MGTTLGGGELNLLALIARRNTWYQTALPSRTQTEVLGPGSLGGGVDFEVESASSWLF